VAIPPRAEAPVEVHGLGDADAPADVDRRRLPPRSARLDADRTVEQRGPVEVEADAERLGELARPVAQLRVARDGAAGAHDLDPVERLQGADEDGGAGVLVVADGVEQGVDAVGAVDVSDPGRPEERCRARREPGPGVRGGL
jgi:hypothetical protein